MKKLFFDLGAHHGESLDYFSKKLPDPKNFDVICVEASPLNYEKLVSKKSFYDNIFNDIKMINACVENSANHIIDFHECVSEAGSEGSTTSRYKAYSFIHPDPKKQLKKTYKTVRINTYDIVQSYLKALNIYNDIIIKMDIEGSEYSVLPDLIKVLSPEHTKQIYGEFHNIKVNVSKTEDEKLINLLEKRGIKFYNLCSLPKNEY